MNREKEIRATFAGNCRAFAMGQIVVAGAHQFAAKVRVFIKEFFQTSSYLEGDYFFANTFWAKCTGIFPTVTGVDRNNNLAIGFWQHFFRGLIGHFSCIKKIDNQSVAILFVGFKGKVIYPHPGL